MTLLTASVVEADFKIVPLHMPLPDYPRVLRHQARDGVVRAGFTIHNDGSVRDVQIVVGTHPAFNSEVRARIESWRFTPWPLSDVNVESVSFDMPFAFQSRLRRPAMTSSSSRQKLSCGEFLKKLQSIQQSDSRPSLGEWAMYFPKTVEANYKFFQGGISYNERQRVMATDEAKLPALVESCQKSPASDYVDFLKS
ncbi:energy transducer TonB [Pseudomonas sp. LS1212]|uniref:energy transducer TonB n=1 Tax=Pseudomonas sp. LS1212 TaxID=2972478 RepID=UPI00215D53F6|nr:energy transducer TonB [Pseudomonas sp. LS1212]UVJ44217.1 energy transducer TonB [Pseudomonas sp. LS1212]